jgi:hypothetical protein
MTIEHRHELAKLLEPRHKPRGLRTTAVRCGDRHQSPDFEAVRKQGKDGGVVGSQLDDESWMSGTRTAEVRLGGGESGEEARQRLGAYVNPRVVHVM